MTNVQRCVLATITKNSAGNWEAIIRKNGWPTASKDFRTKKDAQGWARRVEDEMMRGVYVDRAPSKRMLLRTALARYLAKVTPTKGKTTIKWEKIDLNMNVQVQAVDESVRDRNEEYRYLVYC